ncbi:mitochondrial putative methionyl-tRNA synthetase [Triangularia verruculosa]|uniref:Probable methionine--tRNA ligase, mitochondrial n=1 Tax=Triangularia verruculosa TaxID=2587418 RepID=A0AAN7AXZ3_9PEZI|nr:mitochondrial putative methionyl-tRNA synthetase [Triangularia verruculosa]
MEFLKAASLRRLPTSKWQSLSSSSSTTTTRLSWTCSSSPLPRRRFTTSLPRLSTVTTKTETSKPYYVTTPIFYVNAAPHIGHMYSMTLADVLKRYQQTLHSRPAILLTGTDEHGMKIQQAASNKDMHPKQFCDETAEQFKELAATAEISYDRFMRTTDQDHVQAVEHFWFLLQEKGLIYESKHEGWYSVSDEAFYPESQIEKRQDPFTGEVFMASVESGSKVEWVEEKNYHFRMTAMREKLLRFYEENPEWVVPQKRMADVVDWVRKHLTDLSISRPVGRLSWGIRVPGDGSQTIYVWVDALINYITAAGFPNWTPGRTEVGGWPADVHVIGKDIVRFHCVYWPALLLALDLPMPKQVLTHAHWTMNRTKMSKSLGNVVNPMYVMNVHGTDVLRFYLMFEGGIANDADYSNDNLLVKHKKYLQGGVGNLVSRITRSKLWNLREIVARSETGRIKSQEERFAPFEQVLAKLPATVDKHMEKLDPVSAIRAIMEVVTEANALISEIEPWRLKRSTEQKDHEVADEMVYLAAESLRICGILLQPFLPTKAAQLLDILGVPLEKRTFKYTELFSDSSYGEAIIHPGKGREDSLFPALYAGLKAAEEKLTTIKKERKQAKKRQRQAERGKEVDEWWKPQASSSEPSV